LTIAQDDFIRIWGENYTLRYEEEEGENVILDFTFRVEEEYC